MNIPVPTIMRASMSARLSRQLIRLSMLVICTSAFAVTAEAARLKVIVIKKGSSLGIRFAQVCYKTLDNSQRRDSRLADGGGVAEFRDAPTGLIRLVVAYSGFVGEQLDVNITGSYNEVIVDLEEGSGGPACPIPVEAIQLPPVIAVTATHPIPIRIKIKSFQINSGTDSTTNPVVTLNATFEGIGSPTRYRVSESADGINNASWQNYPSGGSAPTHTLASHQHQTSRYGIKKLYFQVKSGENLSNTEKDEIILKPAKFKSYVIAGEELRELLYYAKDQGLGFTSSVISETFPPLVGDDCVQTALNSQGVNFTIPGVRMYIRRRLSAGEKNTKISESRFFTERRLNAMWTLKSPVFLPGKGWELSRPESTFNLTRQPSGDDPRFTVRLRFTVDPPLSLIFESNICPEIEIILANIVLEGPEDDNWEDSNKKWKNAFRR